MLTDGHSPEPTQIALAEFFSQGHFGAHVRRMRDLYRIRRDALVATAERVFDDRIRLGSSASGLHTIAQLRDGANDRSVSARLARGGIDAQPLARYYHDTASTPGLFLGYAALEPSRHRECSAQDGPPALTDLQGRRFPKRHRPRTARTQPADLQRRADQEQHEDRADGA